MIGNLTTGHPCKVGNLALLVIKDKRYKVKCHIEEGEITKIDGNKIHVKTSKYEYIYTKPQEQQP